MSCGRNRQTEIKAERQTEDIQTHTQTDTHTHTQNKGAVLGKKMSQIIGKEIQPGKESQILHLGATCDNFYTPEGSHYYIYVQRPLGKYRQEG